MPSIWVAMVMEMNYLEMQRKTIDTLILYIFQIVIYLPDCVIITVQGYAEG